MEKLIEPSFITHRDAAELEPPYGSRAKKKAKVGRQVSINGEPAHPQTYPVYRGLLKWPVE